MDGNLNLYIFFLLVLIIVFEYIKLKRTKKYILTIEKIRENLYDVAYTITNNNSEDEIYSILLNVCIKLIPSANKGSILILEEDDKFYFKTLVGYSQELKMLNFSKDELFISNIKTKASVIIKDPCKFDKANLDLYKNSVLDKHGALQISCTISSPLYIDNNLIGLLNIDSIYEDKVFTQEDKIFMNYIKNELELMLKNLLIQRKLRYMANYDELTGLINRRYFRDIFNNEIERVLSNREKFVIVAIDIDDFKNINDTYGHNIGDKVLEKFGNILKENISDYHICARMSGDEFIIIFRGYNEKKAQNEINNIKEKIKHIGIDNINFNFSYGMYAVSKENVTTYDDILIKADRKMYKNKKISHC
ncbi:sensor domain-containing diguanylate cyclase [Clostridium rectalis]|uniref:sensor domain-containing diguanylate cyclase n=1 Tax=Clostridium rectalis TaxID=2040295 RepID=UPI000F62D346|nr:GGDEF domain-containing protein [Clostridium rectalis]